MNEQSFVLHPLLFNLLCNYKLVFSNTEEVCRLGKKQEVKGEWKGKGWKMPRNIFSVNIQQGLQINEARYFLQSRLPEEKDEP